MTDKRILIVDDDDNMREGLRETVRRMGVEVDVAENGRIGFDKASSRPYDLIISDMRMPEVDGLTMFDMLRNSGIDVPICFITAFGTVSGAVDALKNGAYDYILKPFSPDVIEELIRRTFELSAAGATRKREKPGTIYKSAYMAQIFALAREVAKAEATVLITGESGTGKEVLARFIHENSLRENGPFVPVNCAALPENLIESELFGYEKGAFTGAVNKKPGRFEMATGGTILLDEIGEIPLHLQAKLLRVLQEREIERLGGTKTVKVDVRMLATTNRNLKVMSDAGEFREDLYYRLNVISIELPPLRDRKEDIYDLAQFFVNKYSEINHKPIKPLSTDAMETLMEYDWPGNVRELEHTIERAVVLARGNEITGQDLFLHGITVKTFAERQSFVPTSPAPSAPASAPVSVPEASSVPEALNEAPVSTGDAGASTVGKTIAEVERDLILNTLREVGGNRTRAAEILGITVRTLRNKLNEYRDAGISVEEYLG